MKIPRFAGFAAGVCLALATPVIHAQTAPASAAQSGRVTKPLVVVSRQIDIRQMRLSGPNQWHRIEVELKAISEGIKDSLAAQDITDPKVNNGAVKWVNNVKVTLVAGYKPSGSDLGKPKVYQDVVRLKDKSVDAAAYAAAKDASKAENWRYYKATTTVLTLETNQPRSVFFYIPGDIVKRDEINSPKPDIVYVSIEVDGKDVPVFDAAGNLFAGTFAANATGGRPNKLIVDKFKEVADRATRDTEGVMRPQNLVTGFVDGDWSKSSPEFVRENPAK